MDTKLYQVFVKIDGALSTALCILASLFVVAMMLHIVAGIFSRHVLGEPLGGVTEIVSVYDMVAVTFLPLAYVTHRNAHISVELFTRSLSPLWAQLIDTVAVLFVVLLSAWITIETANAAFESLYIREVWESGDGFLSVWVSRLFLPLGIGAMTFTWILEAVRRIGRLVRLNAPAISVR